MTDNELYYLTHPDTWPLGNQLPVLRRGRNVVFDRHATTALKPWAGMVLSDNFCRVWQGSFLGGADPTKGVPVEYDTPEELLKHWAID
jgi:hypothetical protein